MSETPIEIVAALQRRWMKAFGERDFEALVDLYAEDCFLFGGKPALSSGRAAVRAYFAGLPDEVLHAEFGAQSVRILGSTVIVSAGFVDFSIVDAAPLAYRISLTIAQANGDWKIASHHASPVPGP